MDGAPLSAADIMDPVRYAYLQRQGQEDYEGTA